MICFIDVSTYLIDNILMFMMGTIPGPKDIAVKEKAEVPYGKIFWGCTS